MRSSVWLAAIDVVGFPLLIAFFMWHGRELPHWTWIVFPAWLLASFLLHHDTLKTIGLRADNLAEASRQAAIVLGILLAVLLALGMILRQPLVQGLAAEFSGPAVRRLLAYLAFCLVQQFALNSLLTNRLLLLFSRRWVAAVCAGSIFAALHWPNPVLVPCTFIAGVATAWLFARHRNILPLAVGQALLGSLVWIAFPAAWHHDLRVGPSYYLFGLH